MKDLTTYSKMIAMLSGDSAVYESNDSKWHENERRKVALCSNSRVAGWIFQCLIERNGQLTSEHQTVGWLVSG
jgi:hypothetical protein